MRVDVLSEEGRITVAGFWKIVIKIIFNYTNAFDTRDVQNYIFSNATSQWVVSMTQGTS